MKKLKLKMRFFSFPNSVFVRCKNDGRVGLQVLLGPIRGGGAAGTVTSPRICPKIHTLYTKPPSKNSISHRVNVNKSYNGRPLAR